jgi:hypothetical protein
MHNIEFLWIHDFLTSSILDFDESKCEIRHHATENDVNYHQAET